MKMVIAQTIGMTLSIWPLRQLNTAKTALSHIGFELTVLQSDENAVDDTPSRLFSHHNPCM